MRKLKKWGLFILCLLLISFGFTASASAEEEKTTEELYKRQYETSGADELDVLLPEDTRNILMDVGFGVEEPDGMADLNGKKVTEHIIGFFTNGIAAPLKTTLALIGIMIIFASFEGIGTGFGENNLSVFACFVASVIAVAPVFDIMEGVKLAVQTVSNFMLGLVPVYTGIMLSMGKSTAASGFSTLLLGAAEAVSYLISYLFIPLSGAVLCLGVCGGISPVPTVSRLAGWIKKTSVWAMGIATTLFLSILSLQSSFSSVTDGLAMRTSKAVLSTTIPIMGPAIAETVNTARGCMEMLKSSVGIYAALALIIIALPTVIQVFLWRVSMWIGAGVAEIFGMKQVENMLRSVDFCLSVLLSAVLFITLLFIISLAIGTGVG